jgi:hypothetical protein
MIVTAKTLRLDGACEQQVEMFIEIFGPRARVRVTKTLCVQHADRFDWEWAALHLLSQRESAEYSRVLAPARAEYNRAMEAAQEECNRAMWAAQGEYKRAMAAAFGRLAEGTP